MTLTAWLLHRSMPPAKVRRNIEQRCLRHEASDSTSCFFNKSIHLLHARGKQHF
ncbi:hypothetical protein BN2497_589 [Janthinobacterium sp. CG23_2]|nr:hypothetical protein BN2497_589 [Janthinobacterium sp. CG23_2]CUU26692.1 hypothetical protein BN3177_589 [Janthinobacterium sp. CG23_2]